MYQKRKPSSFKKYLLFLSLFLTVIFYCTACGNSAGMANAPTQGTVQAAPSADIPASRDTISVNSIEQVAVIPDIAEVVYAVRTEAKDAASCQQQNNTDVNNVISLLKSLGIDETAIQTSDYYMYPIYNYSGNTQKLTGYEASTSLTVSKLPIDNLGDILAESVKAGINNIQSITYQSSKYDEAYSNALKLAMESAGAKASALAEAGNCSLGNVVGVRENSNYSEARYTDHALSSKMREAGSLALESSMEDTSIMPGEINIEVNITVDYLIRPATP